jgi:hypothetical protein
MEPYFASWNEAREYAEARVRETRQAHGLEKWRSPLTPGKRFRVFMLPRRENRYGHELTCESYEPEHYPPVV